MDRGIVMELTTAVPRSYNVVLWHSWLFTVEFREP